MPLPSAAYPAAIMSAPGEINTGKDGGLLFETVVAGDLVIPGDHLNTMAVELRATQTELGTDPAGTKTDVKSRLAISLAGDGSIAATDKVVLSGIISPSQITADQDNYAPTGLSTANTLRLNSDAARNITGLTAGSSGEVKVIHNVGSFAITLKDESASSTAANRFALTADLEVAADAMVVLQYDGTSARWRAVSGGGGTTFTDRSVNLLLNPGFDSVLYVGAGHTTAITRLNASNSSKNSCIPAWKMWTGTGATPDTYFEHIIGTIDSRVGRFGRIKAAALASTTQGIYQEWSAAQFLTEKVEGVRGNIVPFAMDLCPSHASVSVRLFIYDDVTGFSYGTAVTGTTSWTRSVMSATINAAAVTVRFGVEITAINAANDTVHTDRGMVVTATATLTTLPWVPRAPTELHQEQDSSTNYAANTSVAGDEDYQSDSGNLTTAYDINANRPAWANVVLVGVWAIATAAPGIGTAVTVRPTGYTNTVLNSYAPSTAFYNISEGLCSIGQDGQVNCRVTTANVSAYWYFPRWIGVDL